MSCAGACLEQDIAFGEQSAVFVTWKLVWWTYKRAGRHNAAMFSIMFVLASTGLIKNLRAQNIGAVMKRADLDQYVHLRRK
jgi:hypothetical protein